MIKAGLIGLGKMGKYHLNIMDELPNLDLIAVCDANPEAVAEVTSRMNIAGFTDFREMLPLVDAVTIAAPTRFHYEIARACLEAGKHVLVEKPITVNFKEAEHLFEIAEAKNLVLHIGHVERFNGAVQEVKKLIANPYLLESRRVGPFMPNFKADSIVLDLMIHDIDIILNLINEPVTSLSATGHKVYSDLPDFANVSLNFAGGAVANIVVSRVTQKKDRTLSISQDDAFIYLDYTSQDINIFRKGMSQHIFGNKELTYRNEYTQERLFVYKDNPLKMEIKHFIDCVDGNTKRVVTVEHELRSLRVALKVDELLMTGNKGFVEL